MRNRSVTLPRILAGLGCGLLLAAGALRFLNTGEHLDDNDAALAMAPRMRLILTPQNIQSPLIAHVNLPDTPRWQRIRRAWGNPEAVITAFGPPTTDRALCLPKLPLQVEVAGADGKPVALHPGPVPYGYSAECDAGSLRFPAIFDGFRVKLTATPTNDFPAREIIVRFDWPDLKDKLISLEVANRAAPAAKWTAIAAGVLLLASGLLFLGRRMRKT